MVRDGIWDILQNDATLEGLLGEAGRIYKVAVSQKRKAPFLLVSVISMDDTHAKDTPSYIDYHRMRLICAGATASEVEALANQVRTVLDGYVEPNELRESPTLYVPITKIETIDDADSYDAEHDEYQIIMEIMVSSRRYTLLRSVVYTNDDQTLAEDATMTNMVPAVNPDLQASTKTYTITAGALPAGVALDSGTGVISGAPTTVGSYSWTVTLTGTTMLRGAVTEDLTMTVT